MSDASDQIGLPAHGPDEREVLSVKELSRRDVVWLLSSVAMGLAGCGSGSSSTGSSGTPPPPPPPPTIPTGLSTVNGTVILPSGSGLALSSLTLKTMGQTVALSSGTGFAIGISPSTPTLAMVVDASGNGIMAGFLDPANPGSQQITARTTGVVLTWFNLGGPFLPGPLKSQVLSLLGADGSMDTLGSVISQRIAATPLAVSGGDAQVAAALTAAVNALTASIAGTNTPIGELSDPPTLTITPPIDQSGVSVRTDNTIIGVDISNYYQRPVRAYIYETQTKTAGTPTDISPARLAAGPIDLGEPSAFTAVGGIQSLLGNATPFKSYTIDPIALALDGLTDETTYEVVIIGPSATGVMPGFFSAPRYAAAVPGWNNAIDQMFARVYFCDLLYAAMLEMSGFGSVLPTSPNLVAASASTKLFAGIPFSGGAQSLPSSIGLISPALANSLNAILADQALCNQYLGVAPTIMDKVEAQVLQQVNKVDWQASLRTATNFVSKLGSPFSNYQAKGSISKLFKTLGNADAGMLWAAVVAKQKVTIAPANPSVVSGQQVALTAVLAPELTSTYEFDWTTSSSTASLSAVGETNVGIAINTRVATVNLITSPADVPPYAPITVSVVVYDIANGHRTLVARTTASVDVLAAAHLTPVGPFLTHGDHQTFTASLDGTLPSGVQYLWTLTGTAGTIGALSFVTTTVPTISYTANQQGVDTLQVQIVDATNHLLGKASTQINVDASPSIQFTLAGTWDLTKQPPNGTYGFTDMHGTREPSPGGGGLDALFIAYDVAPSDGTIGVLLTIMVPTGSSINTGDTFSKFVPGQPPVAGQWQLTLASIPGDPANTDSRQWAPIGFGPFRFDKVTQLGNGSFTAQYSFSIDNGVGGIINGSGVAAWT